jgi:WD40 repeat protein
MLTRTLLTILICACAALPAGADSAPAPLPVADVQRTAPVDFEKEILPVLSANCLACHNRTKAKADLVLETPTDILKGGESGPAVVPKNAGESLLLKVSAHREEPVMPPKGNKVAAANLTPEQLGLLKLWIDQGATGTIGGASVPTVQWQPVPAGLHAIYAVALSPDGQHAAASRGDQVHVYHLPSGKLVARLADSRLAQSVGGAAPRSAAHRDLVQSLAFSPDGNLLASGAYREVKVWRRPRDSRRLSITSAARGAVNGIAVAPDRASFATAGADGVVRLWGAKDGRPVREFAGHAAPVTAIAFSPDGTKLASVAADKNLRVWAVADGSTFAQGPCPVECSTVVWAGGGKQLVTAGGDAIVRVWVVPEAAGAALVPGAELKGHEGNVQALCAFPSQPTQVVSAGADGTIRLWDIDGAKVIRQMSHGGAATSVAVRSDGKRFASAGANVVKLWDPEGKLVAEMKGDRYANEAAQARERDLAFAASEIAYHKGYVESLDKRHAEQVERVRKAAVADVEAEKAVAEKKKLHAAEVEAKKPEADVKKAEAEVKKAEAARAGTADELRLAIKSAQQASDVAAEALAAMQSAEREHKQVELELPTLKAAAAAAEQPVRAVAFSPDGTALAAGGDDRAVHTYSAETGTAWETLRGHQGAVTSIDFLGDAVVSGGADGAAVAWDPATQWTLDKQLGTGDAGSVFADRVTALDFSADGKLLATGGGVPSRDGEALLWDLTGGTLVRRFERLHSDAVLALDLSADGRFLATAAADRFVKVSDAASGRLIKAFEGHTGHVLGVAWQRTGRTLASGAADNSARVWDLVAGEQKKAIAGFDKEVTSVRFVGDTDQFLAAAGDGKLRLLKPDGGEVRAFAGSAGFVYATAATRDGTVVIAGGEDGVLRVWECATSKLVSTFPPPENKPAP